MLQIANLGYYNNDGKGLVWHGSDASETQKIKLLQTLLGVKTDGILGGDTASAIRKKYPLYVLFTNSAIKDRIDMFIEKLQAEMLERDAKAAGDKAAADDAVPWYKKHKWTLAAAGALTVGLVVAKRQGMLGDLGALSATRSSTTASRRRSRRSRTARLMHGSKQSCEGKKKKFYKLIGTGQPCQAATVWDHASGDNCAWASRSERQAASADRACKERRWA